MCASEIKIVQLVTGCHNIAGRSRTCSEYKDDFLLALNAFGCLLQCAQRLRLLPTLAQRARLLRLLTASAPPCRRRLMWVFVERLSHPLRLPVVYGARLLWVFVERLSLRCASVSKTTHLDSPHCLCALVVGLAVQTLLRLLDSKILA